MLIKGLKYCFHLFFRQVFINSQLNFTFLNMFYYKNLHSDPFGSESERFDCIWIRILQNVRIISDSDSDPQHCRIGCRKSRIGFKISRIGCRTSKIGCRMSRIGFRMSRIGCRMSRIG